MRDEGFEGEVVTRWLVHSGSDRRMRLEEEFAFVDSTQTRWAGVPGDVIDGASIPEGLWGRVVGTPFVGDYRRATVVHDVAVDHRMHTSERAHRMFYEAMLADGTSTARALLMYLAVRLFGPQWPDGRGSVDLRGAAPGADPDDIADEIDFDKLEAAITEVLGG